MSISSYTGSTLPDPTVLIIDDHELVATSLAMTLRSAGLQAQRHAVRSREGILVATATIPPGVVLLDLDLGRDPDGTPIDGITLIEGLCRSGWRVLALSGTSDEARIGKALAAGALAGIPKSAALPVLVDSRPAGGAGPRSHAPSATATAHRGAHRVSAIGGSRSAERLARLSDRERAVLDRLARGRRAQSIAEEFVVSVSTVRTQIRAILGKLEVGSQLEAVSLLNEYRAGPQTGHTPLTTLSRQRCQRLRHCSQASVSGRAVRLAQRRSTPA